MTELRELLDDTIMDLGTRFEAHGYNPTPIVDLGVLVARADGVVDEQERAALREVFEGVLGERLGASVVDHLIKASLEVIDAAGAEPRARLVAEILVDCAAVEQGLVLALIVAFSSEGLSSAERGIIEQIARAAKVPQARLESLVAQVKERSEGGLGPPPPSLRHED